MTVLVSPDGTRYETDDAQEINRLTLGHGYRIVDDEATTATGDPVQARPATDPAPAQPDQSPPQTD